MKYLIFFTILVFLHYGISAENQDELSRAEILLSEEKYRDVEKLIFPLLDENPVNSKAEYLLTKAWVGIARQERKKGNIRIAREYYKKALQKWSLNQELQNEVTEMELSSLNHRLVTSNIKPTNNSEWTDLLKEIRDDLHIIRENLQKESNTSSGGIRQYILYVVIGLLVIISIQLGILIRK
ncbi:hypothetical protein [Leptospira dzoumogneensis]|uniref:Tetratricopeptide repeat protein n=1 Tax=Leptospira dzoumogneensis TaxID=2484904 RepID=A0A4Z1AQE2_9LEPT|nr:hypothetical protein [Leptospira dzoumogneensis]TGM97320.1 hypothetical protein EHR06_14320 [Leptospira dzoumogneensis]